MLLYILALSRTQLRTGHCHSKLQTHYELRLHAGVQHGQHPAED